MRGQVMRGTMLVLRKKVQYGGKWEDRSWVRKGAVWKKEWKGKLEEGKRIVEEGRTGS